MGMHFIWQRINVLLCLLLTKLILEDYLVIKCRFWLQNCVILDLNVPRACMCLLCCLAITFNQSIMIGLCPLHHLGSSLRFLWPFCVSVSLLNTLSFCFFFFNSSSGLPWWLSVKNPPASAGNVGLIPGPKRSPGEGNSNPLEYSCLGNPMDREAWRGYSPGSYKRVRHNSVTKQQQLAWFTGSGELSHVFRT